MTARKPDEDYLRTVISLYVKELNAAHEMLEEAIEKNKRFYQALLDIASACDICVSKDAQKLAAIARKGLSDA